MKSNHRLLAVLLVIAAAFSLAGFDWGLPSPARVGLLFDNDRDAVIGKVLAVTDQVGFSVNRHVQDKEKNPRDLLFLSGIQTLSETSHADDLYRVYRHYFFYSETGDVSTVFGPLSRMRPHALNFNPEAFQYGGMLLYPVAVLIKAASVFSLVHLEPSLNYYIEHVDQYRRMTQVGRVFVVLMNVLAVYFLFRAGELMFGAPVGFLAALLFLIFPAPMAMARSIKPHLVGVAWVLGAFYYALRYHRDGGKAHLIASGVFSGLAAGTAINYGVSALFPLVAIAVSAQQHKWRAMALVAVIPLAVFLLTNPYFLFNLDIVKNEMAYQRFLYREAPVSVMNCFRNVFSVGVSPWMTAWFFAWTAVYLKSASKKKEALVLLAPPFVYFLLFSIMTRTACVPRFAIFIHPFVALLCAYGVWQAVWRWRAAGVLLAAIFIAPSLIYARAQLSGYRDNARGATPLYEAAAWLRTLPRGTSIGCVDLPKPDSFPAIPFNKYQTVTFPDKATVRLADVDKLPDYFVSLEPLERDDNAFVLEKTFRYRFLLLSKSWIGIENPAPDVYIYYHRKEGLS